MTEAFLHHIWQFKKFNLFNLYTTCGKKLEIIHSGYYNTNAGPDFSLAKLKIDEVEWSGNVEIHVKSSDWLKHKHDSDTAYNNLILHVVYEEDKPITSLKEKNILTLELKKHISEDILQNYSTLKTKNFNFIPCEHLFSKYLKRSDNFSLSEKLYLTKLQEKYDKISYLLNLKNNDWEAVLIITLAYTFGLKINADAFEQLLISLDHKIIRKISHKPVLLEALLFNLTHNLEYNDEYPQLLKEEFNFLKAKYKFSNQMIEIKYLRLRPANFPTIRLSQLASLISQYQNLFSYVIGARNIDQYFKILEDVKASSYWNNHYVFDKKSSKSIEKKLSKSQKELIILNCFLPIKFAYSISIGKSMDEEIINIISKLSVENNSIIDNFKKLGINFRSALDSQAFLHLYKIKCSEQQCLQCEIGYEILK